MDNIAEAIRIRCEEVIASTFPELPRELCDVKNVQATNKKSEGDFQLNQLLAIYNRFRKEPELSQRYFKGAQTISEAADILVAELKKCVEFSAVSSAKQGFVTLTLNESVILDVVRPLGSSMPVYESLDKKRIVIDYSSPNIAKEMHVGHLRSTIIGESMSRVLESMGHEVLRHNHLGDWGTQFGMLIQYMREAYPQFMDNRDSIDISDLNVFYKKAKQRFDEDEEFKVQARLQVVALQSGEDHFATAAWKLFCDISRDQFEKVYKRLGTSSELTERGESFYNAMIPRVIEEVKEHLTDADGAKVWFTEGGKKNEVPLMVVKSDGGYGYDSTDLAAVRYRSQTLKAQRIIITTDIGQNPHFVNIFRAADTMKWTEGVQQQHVGFGLVLGEDGKKFKTRSGEVVKLVDLLDEAVSKARVEIVKRLETMSEDERLLIDVDSVSKSVGYGAVKYFDLKQHRTTNYRFCYEDMLDYNGNTAVYLLYAFARIHSIFRKVGRNAEDAVDVSKLDVKTKEERDLMRCLSKFAEIMELCERDLHLHRLAEYAYEICVSFTSFFSNCKVVGDARQENRLAMCSMTLRLLAKLFFFLGIEPVKRI